MKKLTEMSLERNGDLEKLTEVFGIFENGFCRREVKLRMAVIESADTEAMALVLNMISSAMWILGF